ncbi:MAG: hypothetical protein JNL01_16665 [Bdellovibrionales bacterium]|nr:hypothetical protein [Bdellovibrionales bacterium]
MKFLLAPVLALVSSCGSAMNWSENNRTSDGLSGGSGNSQSYFFFADSSFTIPSGFSTATVEVIGAGGGGGGGGNGSSSASGGKGGRGGYASIDLDVSTAAGQNWVIQVGAGGAAGMDAGCNASPGSVGQGSQVSYTVASTLIWSVSASGGTGGQPTMGCNPGADGSNGVGAGGDVNGVSSDSTYGVPGQGGQALSSAGGTTGTAGSAGYVVIRLTE